MLEGGLALVCSFSTFSEHHLTLASILTALETIEFDVDGTLVPPVNCPCDDPPPLTVAIANFLASPDYRVLYDVLFTLRGWFQRCSGASACLAPCVLSRIEEFLADCRLRTIAIEGLSFCVAEITNPAELLGILAPLIAAENEADAIAVLHFVNAVIECHGADVCGNESLSALVENNRSYRVKVLSIWPVLNIMNSGGSEIVRLLIKNGVVGFLCDLLGGELSEETARVALIAFNHVLEVVNGPVEEADAILEVLETLTKSVDCRVADLAKLAQERITIRELTSRIFQ
jgi:hypothetical protein